MIPSDSDYNPKIKIETGGQLLPDEPPFHIVFLGDWSGKESRSEQSELSKLKPIEVDRDNFDEVLGRFNVQVKLDFQENNSLTLDFKELEDFHPDNIFERLPLFADLRDVRRRLTNSNTFGEAAREVRSWFAKTASDTVNEDEAPKASVDDSQPAPDNLLDRILTRTDGDAAVFSSQNSPSSELNAFVKNIVKPHLVKIDTEEQSELLMVIDEVISDLMRKILHHPQFQSLESAWRGAYFLVRRTETDSDLKIFLLDISKSELSDNLKSLSNLTDSVLFRILSQKRNQFGESEPWASVFGNYIFSLDVEDVATLIRIAKISADNESPFIAGVKPEIFGFDSFEQIDSSDSWKIDENSAENKLWNALRSIPESVCLGLATPRVLARLPYGEKTEPTEAFYFEEFTGANRHEDYLWFNPAFIGALLLAQTFRRNGWNMTGNFSQDITDLPVHYFQEDNENKTKPCAEITMTQTNYEKILDQGLIPVISYKNTDKVRLGEFRSVAFPESSLRGRWT